jgi:hypothetical protein
MRYQRKYNGFKLPIKPESEITENYQTTAHTDGPSRITHSDHLCDRIIIEIAKLRPYFRAKLGYCISLLWPCGSMIRSVLVASEMGFAVRCGKETLAKRLPGDGRGCRAVKTWVGPAFQKQF